MLLGFCRGTTKDSVAMRKPTKFVDHSLVGNGKIQRVLEHIFEGRLDLLILPLEFLNANSLILSIFRMLQRLHARQERKIEASGSLSSQIVP